MHDGCSLVSLGVLLVMASMASKNAEKSTSGGVSYVTPNYEHGEVDHEEVDIKSLWLSVGGCGCGMWRCGSFEPSYAFFTWV